MTSDVLIIGAGPAGIVSSVALQRRGIAHVVYERADIPGSTWASLYPSLRLNTTRFFSHMPGMRFPLRYGLFPSGKQYYEYLKRYVQRHRPPIVYGVEVRDVRPENGLWRVESTRGVEHFRAVISATGIWNRPVMPQIEGMAAFRGAILHAHDFRCPSQVAGQRVLVVGVGPSGVDIAVASAEVAAHVSIGIRSGVALKRRYPFGLPVQAWMLLTERLPKPLCQRIMRAVMQQDYGDLTRWGLPPSKAAVTAYQGPELLNAVRAGKVHPVAAPVCFTPQEVVLADGARLSVDVVIMATGYEPVLHDYLKIPMQYSETYFEPGTLCEYEVGPNGQRGWPLLDRSQHPNGRQVLGYPGLYLVGVWYKGKGAMYNFNVEAAIAAEQIEAYLRAG
jgi:putative flavoprotein involved in K+ transport